MRAIEDAKVKSYNELEKLVSDHESRFNVIAAFADNFGEVKLKLADIKKQMVIANSRTNSTTEAKDLLLKELCEATATVAKPVFAYADVIGDVELMAKMKVTIHSISTTRKDRIEGICQDIFDKATELTTEAAAYNLTAAMLNEQENLVEKWKVEMTATGIKQAQISTALQNITRLVKEISGLLTRRLDKMVATLQGSDPEIVSLWNEARKVKDPPTTTTQALITVKNKKTGAPETDADVVMSNGVDVPAKTNQEGEALYKPIKFGYYDLKVTAAGSKPFLLKNFRVRLGKINRTEVMLEAD